MPSSSSKDEREAVPSEAPSSNARTVGQEISPLRILLVEDTVEIQFIVGSFLKSTPHTLDIAENGLTGVEKFKEGDFDLVLMDMEMPVMDGCTATRAIRRWEVEQGRGPTPIIALTAHGLLESRRKSSEAGCDTHLTKPIGKAVFLAILAQFSRRKRD